ncbi:translocation/assembly module TamB domain-containing protein [Empedobacter brevis]|uniref:translocation/assembly module TamB domain-containing protein n=1 Tax=Empedobacter brevis TaxID=247 RepID=UPI0028A2A36D|nr:translocation/assembly module TamB domain-containing protein [Empedobacter brevis]
MKIVRRIGRFLLSLIILVLTLVLTVAIAIQIPAVQTKIAHFALEKLNQSLNTQMYVDSVDIDFFGRIYFHGVKIKDDHKYDFMKSKTMETTINLWTLLPGIKKDHIDLNEVKLIQPEIRVITYKGDSISNFIKFVNGFSSDKPKDPKKIFKLDGNFILEDGKVSIVNRNSGNIWLDSKQLNMTVKNFRLVDSDITADLENFCFTAVKNKEIYNVQNFTGKVHYSKKEIRIGNLNLRTDTSVLNGNLLLSYEEPSDMSDFADKVRWDVFFERGSKINFKEIRYFTEQFDKNSSVDVYGKVDGTLNNLTFSDFELKGGDNYIGASRLQLQDVLHGSSLRFSTRNAKVTTSYQSITKLLPTFISRKIPDILTRFGNLNYRGDISLNPNEINANGYAVSGLGDADLNAQIRNYKDVKSLIYKGTLDAKNLNLRQLTNAKDLGYVSGKFRFDGRGTDLKNINLDVDGTLRYMDLMGKRYQNITVDGLVKNYQFNGLFDIKDPNLNAQLNGKINFSGKPYDFDFTSNIRQVNLDFIGLTKNLNAVVRGNVTGNFKLTNINDLRGNIDVKNLYFRSKKDTLELAHVILNSEINGSHKIMTLDVPEYMRATVDGKFNITEVADVMNNSLVDLVPSFRLKKVSPNQAFSFDVYVQENLLKYIDPSIMIEPDTHIKGYIDGTENQLEATLNTPGIKYAGIQLFQSNVNLNTIAELPTLNAKIDSLKVSGVTINAINVNSVPKNDTMIVKTDFNIGRKSPILFNLNLFHTVQNKNDLIFGFSPSTIQIDSTQWTINHLNDANSNRILFNRINKSLKVEDLSLESEAQYLKVSGLFNNNIDYNFNADFKDLHLQKIIPKTLLNNLKIVGVANGKVDVVRTKEKLEPTLEAKIDSLGLNDFELGNLTLQGGYDVAEKTFNFGLSLQKEQIESLMARGNIINKPTGPELDVLANFDEFHVDFLEGFLKSVFSNMRGTLSGDLKIDGPVDLPNLNGNMIAKDLGLKVNFLGTDYLFEGENELLVSKQGAGQGIIMLNDVAFKETAYNTKGKVDGAILFKSLSKWGLNLDFDTDNLLVMNTSIKDNELFYGKVFAKGNVTMFGAVEELEIAGDATVVGNSELTINTGSTTIESENNLVRFVPHQHIEDKEKNNEHRTPKGMSIDVNINAYPNSMVNLIFDAATNDKATARGTAENLRFLMNKAGLSITGVYNIESGTYEFRQFPLIPKDFKIKKGSSVQFAGNPLDATLNITAEYQRSVSNVGDYLGIGYAQIYDAILSINISETLKKPIIDFGLTIPNAGSDINSQLQSKFRSNTEEQMLQFSYILLTGKFGDASAVQSGVTSTAADIGLSTIAGMLSSIANNVDIQMEYVGGSAQSDTNDKIRTSVSYRVNNRLSLRGSYGIAVTNNRNVQENFDGNFDITYDISKLNNGALLLRAFTKPTTFGLLPGMENNLNQSFGVGIQYNKNFDTFRGFLGLDDNKKKSKTKTVEEIQEKFDSIVVPKLQKAEERKIDSVRQNTKDSIKVTYQKTSSPKVQQKRRGLVKIK